MGLVEYVYSFRIITEMHSVNSAGALQSGGSLLFFFLGFSILGGSYFVCVDFKKYRELVVIVFFFLPVLLRYLIVLLLLHSMQGIF